MQVKFQNLGTVNQNRVDLGPLTIWFSYETPVAFQVDGSKLICRQNDWSFTTGKLLNKLCPNKADRISGLEFETYLATILNQLDGVKA